MVFTVDAAMDTLKRFDIDRETLSDWEIELGLNIPTNSAGEKQYSPHHINLFKNVRKHVALGRSLKEIRRIITMPPVDSQSQPQDAVFTANQEGPAEASSSKAYGGIPKATETLAPTPSQAITPATPAPEVSSMSPAQPSQEVSASANVPVSVNDPWQVFAGQPSEPIFETPPSIPNSFYNEASTADVQANPGLERPAERPIERPRANRASTPAHGQRPPSASSNEMARVVERLVSDKDQLNKKLLDTEKLNSHLYNANNMFHRKVKEMTLETETLRQQIQQIESENGSLQAMDEKARIQQQLLNYERLLTQNRKQSELREGELTHLKKELTGLQNKLGQAFQNTLEPSWFCGDWSETAILCQVEYDNFGINVEQQRSRRFRISQVPDRVFGTTAIINTPYEYDSNSSWNRIETMTLTPATGQMGQIQAAASQSGTAIPKQLVGELVVEYHLDGVPVAKARYSLECRQV